MGSDACSVIRRELPELSNYEIDQLINSWDNTKSAFENLLGTVWTFDPLVYENNTSYRNLRKNFNYDRYNKLQILSNKVLISNLHTGFRDTGPASAVSCSPGYINLDYTLINDNASFLDNSSTDPQMFKIVLRGNTEDVPPASSNQLWIKITVDPILSDDVIYSSIPDSVSDKATIRRSSSQPIQGRRLKLELNFNIENCSPVFNRLETRRQKISYWTRVQIRNMCSIDNSLLSNHAVLAKCLKYKAGNFSNNIKNIYNNLIVTGAKSKNIIRSDTFDGQACSSRNTAALSDCNNVDPSQTDVKNENCARSLNCEWDTSFQRSMGEDGSTCPGQGTKCLLNDSDTTQNIVDNIENSIGLYYRYQPHRNPYSQEISSFGSDCDTNTITEIESVCFDKNIGISFRFEPVSCTPGHPQFNQATCKSNCGSDSKCTTPVLVSEPDLSAFSCTLDGLDQLENYCKDINESIINNPNYLNLGFTEEQIRLPGYNPTNYPYTGCNEAAVESHLLYIRSLIMTKIEEVNNRINNIIENDAQALNQYSKRRLDRMTKLRDEMEATQNQILALNQDVLTTMQRIGTVNNDYNNIKNNIHDFNNNLDIRFEKKTREFKAVVFFTILIVNILIILIFFRKK